MTDMSETLEAMARAICCPNGKCAVGDYNRRHPDEINRCDAGMHSRQARAALLAFAKCEPSEKMAQEGAAKHRDFTTEHGPYPRTKAMFRAMLAQAVKEIGDE